LITWYQGDRRYAQSTGDAYAKQDALEEGRRRTAGRGSNEVEFDGWLSDNVVNERDDFYLNLEVERDVFLRLTGRAHPRAKGGGMGGGFVMSMVRGMRHRLRIHDAAQDE
jgi:hypothetical protein